MKEKIILVIAILFMLLAAFFFPKTYIVSGSVVGIKKACNCFGFENGLSNLNPNGESTIYCFGIPYNCG